MLAPLAERNGHAKRDGAALLEELLEVAHIDLGSLSKQIMRMPDLAALVARDYLATMSMTISELGTPETTGLGRFQKAISALGDPIAEDARTRLSEALSTANWASVAQRVKQIEVSPTDTEQR